MSRHQHRRPRSLLVGVMITPLVALIAVGASVSPAQAAPLNSAAVSALDSGYIASSDLVGDPAGVAVLTKKLYGFPTQGNSALVLSTGRAGLVADPAATTKLPKTSKGDLVGTDLSGQGSADGNDLTQLKLNLNPPNGASGCMAFDFMFFSEEYPNYKGAAYNDIFTAELNQSQFSLSGRQVVAPNNFAYSEDKEVLSVNTFSKFTTAPDSGLNGRSNLYSAVAKLEPNTEGGPVSLILSVQDLGDSQLDSAVVVDNLRFFAADDCAKGIVPIVDTDGDGLPDDWETKGVDYDGDGSPELDLKAMGANPLHKDIFIEIDWMYEDPTCSPTKLLCVPSPGRDKTPQQQALDMVTAAFAAAPVSNPDKKTGVTVHIDGGPQSIMDPVSKKTWGSLSRANRVSFADTIGTENNGYYDWADFDKIKAKNFDATRADAFHYDLYANKHGSTGSSGRSRALPASDLLMTDGSWGQGRFTVLQEAGTLMHELGHNLRLFHGGDGDNPNPRAGYYSVMNYAYQTIGVDTQGKLDYSRGNVKYGNDATFAYDDWDHLVFTGGSIGSLGQNGPLPATTASDELTIAEARKLDAVAADGDGTVTLIGPTLVAKGIESQVLIADVSNVGATAAKYRVQLDASFGSGQSVTVTVPAGKTIRVEIPIKVDKSAAASAPVTATLLHGSTVLSTSSLDVNAVDLSDNDTADEVRQTLKEVAATPPAGLDPDVMKALDTTIRPRLDQQGSKPAQDSNQVPWTAIIAGGVAVIAILILIAVIVRRRRT